MTKRVEQKSNYIERQLTITAKFGGSAVTARNFCKIKEICAGKVKYCVVSAIGKEFDSDVKITDLLLALAREVKKGSDICKSNYYKRICAKYDEVIGKYSLNICSSQLFEQAFDGFSCIEKDFLVSRGEYLSAVLVAGYLGWQFLDSANLVTFNKVGRLLEEESVRNIRKAINGRQNIVMSGFYGSCNGKIVTFSRGGSDISGSLLACATNSDYYENYIDVNGFLVCSPKLVLAPKTISHISYSQLRQMDSLGAECLHRDSILPLVKNNTPLLVKNYNNHNAQYTVVSAVANVDEVISIVQERLYYYGINGNNLHKRIAPYLHNAVLLTSSRQECAFAVQENIFDTLQQTCKGCEVKAQRCYYTQVLFSSMPSNAVINDLLSALETQIFAFLLTDNTLRILSAQSICNVVYDKLVK